VTKRVIHPSSHLDQSLSLALGSTLSLLRTQEVGVRRRRHLVDRHGQRTGAMCVSFLVLRRNNLPDPCLPSPHLPLHPRLRYSEDSWGRQLPRHTLPITDVELTPSSGHGFPIGVSDLVKDCDVDVASLTGFSCNMTTADVVRHTVAAAASPPIEKPRLICGKTEGLHGMSGCA
jgi:hypothetical protein